MIPVNTNYNPIPQEDPNVRFDQDLAAPNNDSALEILGRIASVASSKIHAFTQIISNIGAARPIIFPYNIDRKKISRLRLFISALVLFFSLKITISLDVILLAATIPVPPQRHPSKPIQSY